MTRGPRFKYQFKVQSCTCRHCGNSFDAINPRALVCPADECQTKAKSQAKAEQRRKKRAERAA